MRSAVVVCCLAALAAACGDDDGGSDAILGGEPITIQDAPWQVSIQDGLTGHFCGGAIVRPEWVLTANHCVQGSNGGLEVVAGIGRLSQATTGQRRAVEDVVPYPGFTSPSAGDDVALLHLASALDLDGEDVAQIEPVDVLGVEAGRDEAGVMAFATGWRSIAGDGEADQLHGVELPLLATEAARAAYPEVTFADDQLAVGLPPGGGDGCDGDSGGPLAVPDGRGGLLLAGILSWGDGCDELPEIYARVSTFDAWILEQVGDDPPIPLPPGDALLVLNEILADPGTTFDANGDGVFSPTDDEYLELVNVGDDTIDLSGATYSDTVSVRGTIADGTTLAPNEVLVLFGGGTPVVPAGVKVQTFPLALNNDGDSIKLLAADGTSLVDLAYGAEAGHDQSITRATDGDPDAAFVQHMTVASTPGSPGTRVDGSPF